MGNDNSDFTDIWEKMNEVRRLEQSEREIRYTSRRSEKLDMRRKVEKTAIKLCGAIEAALEEEHSPNDLAALAAALGGAVTAMHMAENYAESMPMYGSGIGYCAV